MLELENVSKSYAKGAKKAVDSLNLKVKDGEIFGFIGPNGAGKTTSPRLNGQSMHWLTKVLQAY